MVKGYVNKRVTCRMLRGSLMALKSRLYSKVSQFVMLTCASSICAGGYSNSGKKRPLCKS